MRRGGFAALSAPEGGPPVNQLPTIPEDPRLSRRIRDAARRGALGHAVILSGPGDKTRAARFLAAAMECTGEDAPCGQCPACSKVLRDIHPDVITVQDPDHKNISVDVLRDVRADAYIMPNEGRRKIYLFPDCRILEPKTQNVLLKVLEEGPPQAAFIFCAENSAQLLQTIRSRAVEWKLAESGHAGEQDNGARRLCALLRPRKGADITAFCTDLENSKLGRDQLQQLLSGCRDMTSRALAAACGAEQSDPDICALAEALDRRTLMRLAELFEHYIRRCGYNIGVGHLTGALAADLSDCLHR